MSRWEAGVPICGRGNNNATVSAITSDIHNGGAAIAKTQTIESISWLTKHNIVMSTRVSV